MLLRSVADPVRREPLGRHPQGIEKEFVRNATPETGQPLGEDKGQAVDAFGNALEPVGSVIHGIHAGNIGQQHLSGTDVARGPVATNVLLPGL